jgi:hypothetical protein
MWHILQMRYTQLLIVALGIGVISQALAVDPPSQTAAPTATAAPASLTAAEAPQDPAAAAEQAKAEAQAKADAQAKAEAQAKADAQAKAEAQAKADAQAKAIDKRLRAQGYKPMNNNGTLRYCRGEQVIGSRFERQVCGTPEELDYAEKQGQETVRQIQQNNASLPGGK